MQPLYIAHQLTRESHLHLLEGSIGHSVCGVSFLTITVITVDRFLALTYHMRYASLVTKSRARWTLTTLWLISFALLGLYFWNMRVYRFLIGVIIAICLLICTFCYIRIYQIVRQHQLQIHAQQLAVQTFNAGNHTNILRLKKSAVNTFIFYMALIICYFPMYIFLTLNGLSLKDWQTEWNFSATLVFSNSSINPFLYCWRLRELRTAVARTAREMLCKRTEASAPTGSRLARRTTFGNTRVTDEATGTSGRVISARQLVSLADSFSQLHHERVDSHV